MSKIYEALKRAQEEGMKMGGAKTFPFIEDLLEEEGLDEISLKAKVAQSSDLDLRLVPFSQPASISSEQFRKLRSHLLQMNVSKSPKTIMVTSSIEGEGKTFVAANIALGIAYDLQAHALLVDCDLRRLGVASLFGLQEGKGLSDYLLGNEKISDLLRKTELEKLKVLPGGSPQINPAELIGSKKMEVLITELKSRYKDRYVILDSPPLLSTTEPQVLSKLVDGVLIVVRAGVTPRETLIQAIGSLEKEKILGYVLNDLQFRSSGLSSRYFGSGWYRSEDGGNGKKDRRGIWKRLLRRS